MKCRNCEADHTLVGVRFPARRLCRCETGRPCGANNCAAVATIVEFQKPVAKGVVPAAPAKSSKLAQLTCDAHAPTEFVSMDMPAPPPRKRKGFSNVDPQWSCEKPPRGAFSQTLMQCWSCKDVHKMKDRKMHNGSMSLCPKCRDDMTVLADEEEAA